MTLPAWSSVLTGCRPGTHGIYDFMQRDPGTYNLSFLSAAHRRVPTLHRILADAGGRVASIAVPTTFPPETLDGIVIAGFDSPVATTAEIRHCAPASEWPSMVRRFGGLRFADFQEGHLGPGWHLHARDSLLREIGRKEALCAQLLEREPWALFMVVFGESDTASHHFWMFHDEGSPRHAAARTHPDFARLRSTVAEIYQRLDAMVGRLARHGEIVGVVSDHGFGGAGEHAIYINRFLEDRGWLRFRSPTWRRGLGDRARRAALSLDGGLLERLVRRVPGPWIGQTETHARYGPIDLQRTRAWSDELNYAATVHLNIRDRDPLGRVENVPLAIADLTRELLAWEIEGAGVVEKVHVDPYEGAPGAPDLVLTLALRDGYSSTVLPSTRVAPGTLWRRLGAHEHVGGKGLGMNGAHRQHGILALTGPGFPPGEVTASVWDVAPTLLHALGRPIPAHMQGRVLTEVLPSTSAVPLADGARPPKTAAVDAIGLRRRLERLGYL